MSRVYADTSALAKFLVDEPCTEALVEWVSDAGANLAATYLVETELRRFAQRAGVAQAEVSALLTGVDLAEIPPSLFREAGLLPGEQLRSLDALHLAAALRMDADSILTYDERLADAAHAVGMNVSAPGSDTP